MQLFTTYGVQSSVPPKTVVAVIGSELTSTNNQNYNLTFTDNEYYISSNGAIGTWPDHMRTNKVEIINNSIILSLQPSHIFFWNNSTFIGYYSNFDQAGIYLGTFNSIINNGIVTIPNNATHFALHGDTRNLAAAPYVTTWEQFQTIIASYNILTPQQTVTFFDEYPNGTQIGDVVNVTGLSNYSYTLLTNGIYDPEGLQSVTPTDRKGTDLIAIINNSVILNREVGAVIFFNNGSPAGWYGDICYATTRKLGSWDEFTGTPPAGATHFVINEFDFECGGNPVNANLDFSDITASYSTGVAIINPPATYKIRQLVFEE